MAGMADVAQKKKTFEAASKEVKAGSTIGAHRKMHSDKQRLAIEHTDNLEAYDSFLRGREQVWLLTKEGNAQGRKLLQSAIELDPTFAPAYAFLACAHNLDYVNRWSPVPSESLEKADKAAIQAVSLDDQYPYAHWARAITNLYMRRHDLAIQEAKRTISLDPNLAFGHEVLGTSLHFSGRSEEALACFVRAMALDPYFPDVWLHFYAKRYSNFAGMTRLSASSSDDLTAILTPMPRACCWLRAMVIWAATTRRVPNGRRC